MKNKKAVVILPFIILLMAVALILLNSNTDYPVSNVMPSTVLPTIWQTLFVTAVAIAGHMFLLSFSDGLAFGLRTALSPLMGIFLWLIASQLILCFAIPYYAISVILVMILMNVGINILSKTKLKSVSFKKYGIVFLYYFACAALFSAVDFTLLTQDSYTYVLLGKSLSQTHGINIELIGVFSERSLITPAMFTPEGFLGFDYSNGLYLMFGFSFIAFIVLAVNDKISDTVSKKQRWLIVSAVFVVLMVSNIFTALTLFYPISNNISNIALFIAVYSIMKPNTKNKHKLIWLSILSMLIFVLVRTENILIALLLIVLFSTKRLTARQSIVYTGIVTGGILLWYIRFFAIAGLGFTEGSFLTLPRALAVIGACLLVVVYLSLKPHIKLIENKPNINDWLVFIGVILLTIIYTIINPSKMITNMKIVFANLSVSGGWGISFGVLLLGLAITYRNRNDWDLWDKSLWLYVLMLFVIYALRDHSLRIGFGDSGNRMMTGAIPFIVYIVGTKVNAVIQPSITPKK